MTEFKTFDFDLFTNQMRSSDWLATWHHPMATSNHSEIHREEATTPGYTKVLTHTINYATYFLACMQGHSFLGKLFLLYCYNRSISVSNLENRLESTIQVQ